ncbi:hypothetical protein MNB_SUP05-5-1128 [hydrothermal vent metagenome]|uniref:Uncharacterized protein n=1 Tax=hydrothermal vent metagenome TaxID=652676 RepID=A0A1W1CVC0_9ZZZZ
MNDKLKVLLSVNTICIAFESTGIYLSYKADGKNILDAVEYFDEDFNDSHLSRLKKILEIHKIKKYSFCNVSIPSKLFHEYYFEMPFFPKDELDEYLDENGYNFWNTFCSEMNDDQKGSHFQYSILSSNEFDETMQIKLSLHKSEDVDFYIDIVQQLDLFIVCVFNVSAPIVNFLKKYNQENNHWFCLTDKSDNQLQFFDITNEQQKSYMIDIVSNEYDLLIIQINSLIEKTPHTNTNPNLTIFIHSYMLNKGAFVEKHNDDNVSLMTSLLPKKQQDVISKFNNPQGFIGAIGNSINLSLLNHSEYNKQNILKNFKNVKFNLIMQVLNSFLKPLLILVISMFLLHSFLLFAQIQLTDYSELIATNKEIKNKTEELKIQKSIEVGIKQSLELNKKRFNLLNLFMPKINKNVLTDVTKLIPKDIVIQELTIEDNVLMMTLLSSNITNINKLMLKLSPIGSVDLLSSTHKGGVLTSKVSILVSKPFQTDE